MDGAAGAVAFELGEIEHLRDRALAGERGIAVKQDRQHLAAVDFSALFAEDALAGAGLAFDEGIDGFQVAWICREADPDIPVRQLADAFVAEVVFHVAIAGNQVGLVGGSEFVEDGGEGFADEIGEDVHAPAVRHAHFDLLDALRGAGFEQCVEQDYRTLATFVRETLLAEETLAEEIFKRLGFQHPAKRVELLPWSFLGTLRVVLDPFAHPVTDGRVVNMHELEANLVRVSRLQRCHHVSQLHFVAVAEKRVPHLAIEVRGGQAELLELQARIVLRLVERIDRGLGVAERAVVINQTDHLTEERQIRIGRRRGHSCGGGLLLAFHLGRAQFESLKKSGPSRIDRLRVLAPFGVF